MPAEALAAFVSLCQGEPICPPLLHMAIKRVYAAIAMEVEADAGQTGPGPMFTVENDWLPFRYVTVSKACADVVERDMKRTRYMVTAVFTC